MTKLIMTKGLPGSGKSFWAARQEGFVIVNKDDIRRDLETKGWVWSRENEKDVKRIQETLICENLKAGVNVISSDTNFGGHVDRLRNCAVKHGVEFEIKDFTDVPIDICIQRDLKREGKARVGEKVIRDMAEAYLRPDQLVQRTEVNGKQLFLDLDGVFADFDGFIERELGISKHDRASEPPDFWDRIRRYTGRLYADMGCLPFATQLYQRLRQFTPIILTGVPYSLPDAAQDKREWVAKYLDPNVQVVTCKSRNKSKYLIPGDVLLDDSPHHRPAWEAAGGVWITFDGDVDAAVDAVTKAMDV